MIASRMIAMAGWSLPPAWREWPRAMAAELDAIPAGMGRWLFALGCARAILLKAFELHCRTLSSFPIVLPVALAGGLGIGYIDRESSTRWGMWILLSGTSAVLGWLRPVAAWRWGFLLGVGLPLVAAADPSVGPYRFDHADALYGLPVSLGLATVAAWFRRRIRWKALFIALLCASASGADLPAQAQTVSARSHLTAMELETFAAAAFAEYLRESPEPSLAFVVVKADSIIFARGYGSEDPAGHRQVDPERTVFWLASLTKLVTTEAVLREAERGHLSLGQPASRYLGWQLPSCRGCREVTVRDLLTHTSGLDEPFMSGTVDQASELAPLGTYLANVRWQSGTPPGDLLRYSNHAMALAGLAVERVSGVPYADYVEREVFGPLQMAHSTVRQPMDPDLQARLASAGTDSRMDFLLAAPAGAMVGTAADMGRFLAAQFEGGPRRESLRIMHMTHWRAHPHVPGVALGWFETRLGGVNALYHTGARHHFSVAWIAPAHHVGLFLVHSMRQGGRFQYLRTNVVRDFVRRFLPPDSPLPLAATRPAIDGVFRPALLSMSTVERLGYLFLDTPVHTAEDGRLTLRAPGGLGRVEADPLGSGVFLVRTGPHADFHLGVHDQAGTMRIAGGGTLLDPVTFVRVRWWERGLVHLAVLSIGCAALVLTALVVPLRIRRTRKRETESSSNRAWLVLSAAGFGILLALIVSLAAILFTPEIDAARHIRRALRVVRVLLSLSAVLCLTAVPAAVSGWSRAKSGRLDRVLLALVLALGSLIAGLFHHYRLVGWRL